METIIKKTVTNLTLESVSILSRQYVEIDGVEKQIGSNHRCAYDNSKSGRTFLVENEPPEVVTAVMAVWGDEPTVEEMALEIPNDIVTAETTSEERIDDLEAQLLESSETAILLYEGQLAQEEINSAQDVAIIEIYEMLS